MTDAQVDMKKMVEAFKVGGYPTADAAFQEVCAERKLNNGEQVMLRAMVVSTLKVLALI